MISEERDVRPHWWQSGVIYQIYPRSFKDSNSDGIGDLQGIMTQLDYLTWLGVDAIWVSPFYPSPMADFGYDIADYCNVDPIFGDLETFERLIEQAHRRDLKVIIDFVPNHIKMFFQEGESLWLSLQCYSVFTTLKRRFD